MEKRHHFVEQKLCYCKIPSIKYVYSFSYTNPPGFFTASSWEYGYSCGLSFFLFHDAAGFALDFVARREKKKFTVRKKYFGLILLNAQNSCF